MKISIKKHLLSILLLLASIACFLAAQALVEFAKLNPMLIEIYYSNGSFSYFSDFLPFSLAELLIMIIILGIFIMIFALIILACKKRFRAMLMIISFVIFFASALYLQFYLAWGLNYYRMPLSYSIGLPQSPRSEEQLFKLCVTLTRKANELREKLPESTDGTAVLGETSEILSMPIKAFENLSEIFPLKGNARRAKGVFMSEAMCYANISGIYIPYTHEANININQPAMLLPSTTCHEAAHQMGFALEEEANFLAFLACWYSDDIRLQYSGVMLALINAQNSYVKANPIQAYSIIRQYSRGVKRDLQAHNEFWQKYEGKVSEEAQKLNDSYLKANGQTSGIKSYGMMLNLLLDWYYKYLQY